MPLPSEETTPPVMKTNRVMGGQYSGAAESAEMTGTDVGGRWEACAGARLAGLTGVSWSEPRERRAAGAAGAGTAGAGAAAPARRRRGCGRRRCGRGRAAPGAALARNWRRRAPAAGPARVLAGGGGTSRIERRTVVPLFSSASTSDRPKNTAARMAVVRVSRLAVPRPLMNEPMPCEVPMPSPPPSLRWISTTPIRASVTNRWMISSTVVMGIPGQAGGAF